MASASPALLAPPADFAKFELSREIADSAKEKPWASRFRCSSSIQTQNQSKAGDARLGRARSGPMQRTIPLSYHKTVLIAQVEDVRLRRNSILLHSATAIGRLFLGTP